MSPTCNWNQGTGTGSAVSVLCAQVQTQCPRPSIAGPRAGGSPFFLLCYLGVPSRLGCKYRLRCPDMHSTSVALSSSLHPSYRFENQRESSSGPIGAASYKLLNPPEPVASSDKPKRSKPFGRCWSECSDVRKGLARCPSCPPRPGPVSCVTELSSPPPSLSPSNVSLLPPCSSPRLAALCAPAL